MGSPSAVGMERGSCGGKGGGSWWWWAYGAGRPTGGRGNAEVADWGEAEDEAEEMWWYGEGTGLWRA